MLEDAFTRGMFAQISLSGTVICVNAFLLTFVSGCAGSKPDRVCDLIKIHLGVFCFLSYDLFE